MQTLFDAFLHQVRTRGEQVSLIVDGAIPAWAHTLSTSHGEVAGHAFTWNALAETSLGFARRLVTLLEDVDPAHPRCVAYLNSNRFEDVCLSLAAMAVGAVEVPIDSRRDLGHQADVRARVAGVWIDDVAALGSEMPARLNTTNSSRGDTPLHPLVALGAARRQNDPALVLWTTGTIAAPKGVTLSHRNLFINAHAKLAAVPQSPSDVRLTTLPLSHAYARTSDVGTWLLSGCVLGLSLGMRGWLAFADALRPNLANVVPSMAQSLLADSYDTALSRMTLLGVGGAALAESTFHRYRERGITVIQGYGLTEASPVVCSATPNDARAGLVGRPVAGCEIRIVENRLFVRGPSVMLGYWNDPEATRARIDAEGWLDTGDLVEEDREGSGQLRILGRADDTLVLPNGKKLQPREIESLAESVPLVTHSLLLLVNNQLELWLNTEREIDDVRPEVLQRLALLPKWAQPHRMERFSPALSAASDELSFKDTVRRKQVMRTRFADRIPPTWPEPLYRTHAGS